MTNDISKERSLILLKPDAIQRSLIGKIISRFEQSGLKIIGMKFIHATEEHAQSHYPLDEAWAKNVFDKTKAAYDKAGKPYKHPDHMSLGKELQNWLMTFLKEGPIVALVLEGPHAIELARKMIGHTEPKQALPGTIRGDYASIESYPLADEKQRVIRNLVHASDTPENAAREISVWFTESELYHYSKELDKHL
jgi:nucleoside-diphosphate kinase|tara:strand:- start:4 stop:585 length:582 start_codon:yes stop_codon:yes gene_type:complete